MEKTNNTITIKNVFVGGHFTNVPVMRNGKATKRTKRVWVSEYADLQATGYVINGHIVYLLDKDMEEGATDYMRNDVRAYREDGTRLTAMCKYGRYGQTDHEETVFWHKESKVLFCHTDGYNGPCGKGWGASIKRFNW